ncbi:MAG: transcriptional repressor NrdR [Planctomycetes bacterium]|nr:transcriptional repressor NrdR [Planctomycetota bacterium]
MRCPFCHQDDDKVVDTRSSEDSAVIRRRRECLACNRRFTTHERLEEMPLRVIKKSGERVPFSREKLLAGIMRAMEKRPVAFATIEEMADSIERELLEMEEREVASSVIGEMVMSHLREIDAVAYVRFASVYREFKAVDEFVKEIDTIGKARGKNKRHK